MNVIDKLKANRFRGASQPLQLDFDPSKKIAFIFGESGCGKSCIADAIEFALTGRFGSLMEKQGLGRETTIAGYVRSVGAAGGPADAEVARGTESWKASLPKSTPVLTGTSERPPVGVLRRSRLLSFIEAQPAKRYEGLASSVDVPNCIASEELLGKALKSTKDDVEAKSESVSRDEAALAGHWRDEGSPGKSWEEWTRGLATLNTGLSDKEARAIADVVSKIDSFTGAATRYNSASGEILPLETAVAAAEESLTKAQKTGLDAELIDILAGTAEFLKRHSDYARCPVCAKANKARELTAAIDQRVSALKAVREASSVHQKADRALKEQLAVLERETHSVLNGAREVLASIEKGAPDSQIVQAILDKLPNQPDASAPKEALVAALKLSSVTTTARDSLVARRDALQQSTGKAGIVRRLVEQVGTARQTATELSSLQSKLEATLKVVENCRKGYVNGILLSVAGEAERMYGRIHPNEPLGGFKLWLERRNSLMLAGKFESVGDVDPQAYYSESHLDTLGLCIFLALEKRDNPSAKLLVLDDVLTSVDQPHLENTMTLLQDEAPSFGQVIVTTHYSRFFEDFRRRHSGNAQVEFKKLRGWSLREGVRADSVAAGAGDLKSALTAGAFDKKEVAWRGGLLLESMLDYLTSILECKVARRPQGRYTLGDLLPAAISVGDRLKSGSKATKKDVLPVTWSDVLPALKLISSWADVRNALGAHFSLEGVNLSDNDAKEFGQLVLDLHAKLVCPVCGEMVRRDDSKTHWECGCRSFCLMPLKA